MKGFVIEDILHRIVAIVSNQVWTKKFSKTLTYAVENKNKY